VGILCGPPVQLGSLAGGSWVALWMYAASCGRLMVEWCRPRWRPHESWGVPRWFLICKNRYTEGRRSPTNVFWGIGVGDPLRKGPPSGSPQRGPIQQREPTTGNHSGSPAGAHSGRPQRDTTAGHHIAGYQRGPTAEAHSGSPQREITAGDHSGRPQRPTDF
jgi:hypothetical protein